MRATNLLSNPAGGLALDVDAPARPGLRVEVAAGRWILARHETGRRYEHLRPAERWLLLAGDHDGYASRDWVLRHYARAMAQAESQAAAATAHPFTGYVAVNRQLGEALDGIERTQGCTRAWPVPGGVDTWWRQAAATDPAWSRAR